jgi:hypothetical protein
MSQHLKRFCGLTYVPGNVRYRYVLAPVRWISATLHHGPPLGARNSRVGLTLDFFWRTLPTCYLYTKLLTILATTNPSNFRDHKIHHTTVP